MLSLRTLFGSWRFSDCWRTLWKMFGKATRGVWQHQTPASALNGESDSSSVSVVQSEPAIQAFEFPFCGYMFSQGPERTNFHFKVCWASEVSSQISESALLNGDCLAQSYPTGLLQLSNVWRRVLRQNCSKVGASPFYRSRKSTQLLGAKMIEPIPNQMVVGHKYVPKINFGVHPNNV